jgi:hypothetical protein
MKALTKHKMTPPTRCPFCGSICDGASSLTGGTKPPDKGSVTLCIDCGEWAVFDDVPGGLRKPTDAEYDRIAVNEVCRKARFAWVLVDSRRKK